MSYGKEDGHLARIGGYGATQTQQMGNATRRQYGPRKGSPTWANNFQPSEISPDYIRLIPGDFDSERVDENTGAIFYEKVAWFEYTEHFYATKKQNITCSGGVLRMNREKRRPCRGCDISHEDYEERKRIEREKGVKVMNPNRISMSSRYVFLVLDMAWFFKGYRLDEHGRVVVSKHTNQPYQDWIKYNQEHHNEFLYASGEAGRNGKQLEMRNGMVRTWPLGFTQFGTLSGFADVVQKHCHSCGNQNCVYTTGWVCRNCNAPTVDSTLPADELKKLVSKTLRCRHCGNSGYPRPIQTCGYCPNPIPANLYDIDMQVQTVKVQGKRQLIIPWLSPPRPVDPAYTEAFKKMPDVIKKFSPTPYEEQVALFGSPTQAMAAPYGQAQPPQQGWGQPAPQQWGMAPPQQNWQQPPPQYQQPPQAQAWGQPQAPQYQQPGWGQAAPGWGNQSTNEDEIPF